jgi:6-phosphogluconolactonase (cycloisomerase 2 family)
MNALHNFPMSALGICTVAFAFGTACFAATEAPTAQTSRVYSETNASSGNSVLVYNRSAANGSLTLAQTIATGQNGTGAKLAAQGALLLVSHFLLAVNAGSNTISVLNLDGSDVSIAGTFSSGGVSPKSLTAFENTVYVLNVNGISGFTLDETTGALTPIANSSQPLSGLPDPEPAQIGFTNKGATLMVTEKNTNVLDVAGRLCRRQRSCGTANGLSIQCSQSLWICGRQELAALRYRSERGSSARILRILL